jgi:hypothetical protein
LQVLADAAPMSMSQTEGLNDRMTMLANMRFELAAELAGLDSDSPAYVLTAGELPMGQVETLLSIFGIEGELQAPSDPSGADSSGIDFSGGGYFAGSTDGTEPSLYISADAMQYWNYSPPISETMIDPACFDSSDIASVSPPTPVTESIAPQGEDTDADLADSGVSDSGGEAGGTIDSEPPVGDEQPVVEDLCSQDQLPQDVPTEDEAVQLFSDLMSDIGIDADDLVIDAFSDDYGASVVGFMKIDGIRSPLSWTVSYADAGRIVWASGVLSEPQKLADYGRIGTQAGLERLNDQQSGLVDQMAGDPGVDPAASASSDSDPNSVGEIVVQIIDVEEELVMFYGVDGSLYLVPGYAFLADPDELGYEPRFTVTAIADEYIDLVAPSDSGSFTEPGVAEPGFEEPVFEGEDPDGNVSGGEIMQDISSDEANTLLGMSESEATSTAESNGWVVRVAVREGEQFALTMDFNSRRVNLTVENGVVTYVFVG